MMTRSLKIYTASLLVVLIFAGCATTPKESLSIKVTDKGSILVAGKPAALAQVGKAARSAGARSGTMIKIEVPAKVSPDLAKSIKSNLAQAGYPKIFFVRSRQAAAYVNKDDQKPGLKKPAPSTPRLKRR